MSARSRLGGWLPDERGATAVELALCLPVLLALVTGIFQFGWAQHTRSSIRFAMEDAARGLVINPNATTSDIQAQVSDTLETIAGSDVTVSLAKADTVNGRVATLTAAYTSSFGLPGLATFTIPYNVSITTALRAT